MAQQQFLTRKEWIKKLTDICDTKNPPPDERKEIIKDLPRVVDEIYLKRFYRIQNFDGFVSKRVYTVLLQSGLTGLEELLRTPKGELKKVWGCGEAVIKELEYFLDDMGFELK